MWNSPAISSKRCDRHQLICLFLMAASSLLKGSNSQSSFTFTILLDVHVGCLICLHQRDQLDQIIRLEFLKLLCKRLYVDLKQKEDDCTWAHKHYWQTTAHWWVTEQNPVFIPHRPTRLRSQRRCCLDCRRLNSCPLWSASYSSLTSFPVVAFVPFPHSRWIAGYLDLILSQSVGSTA